MIGRALSAWLSSGEIESAGQVQRPRQHEAMRDIFPGWAVIALDQKRAADCTRRRHNRTVRPARSPRSRRSTACSSRPGEAARRCPAGGSTARRSASDYPSERRSDSEHSPVGSPCRSQRAARKACNRPDIGSARSRARLPHASNRRSASSCELKACSTPARRVQRVGRLVSWIDQRAGAAIRIARHASRIARIHADAGGCIHSLKRRHPTVLRQIVIEHTNARARTVFLDAPGA